jgi:hypothetical protein
MPIVPLRTLFGEPTLAQRPDFDPAGATSPFDQTLSNSKRDH